MTSPRGRDARLPARSPRLPRAGAVLLALAALVLAACGGGGDDTGAGDGGPAAATDWSAVRLAEEAQDAPVTPVLANSSVGVGESRLAFALFDREQQLVTDATGTRVRLYTLDGDRGEPASEHALQPSTLPQEETPHLHTDGAQHLHDAPQITVYVATVQLTRPEWWGAEVSFQAGGKEQRQRLRFFVREATSEPAVGQQAPASVQKTLRDGIPLTDLDTSTQPQAALHEQTIAEAVSSGKVSVIAFATPAFCQTRFCGPVVESVVRPAWERYGDRINVLHVEPYDVPAARSGQLKPEPVMAEWGLQTEPWVFVVGRDGRVTAKFEGILSPEELTAAIDRALAAG